ncbi:MAG: SMC-Scp complex subunit ScpB [bacterium]|nr:SMC-Scp complex subunit ScpB [bacterium]
MTKDTSIVAKIEALLFIYGEPIDAKKLAKILGEKESDIKDGVEKLSGLLVSNDRGLTLVRDGSQVQLVTKSEFSTMLETMTKQEFTEELTPASLETLAIVAYAGPVTRADIEYIRGVNSSFTLRALLMRGLVDRHIDPKRSNAYLYKTSFELLRHLGLSQNENLPEYEKYKGLVSHLHQALAVSPKVDEPRQGREEKATPAPITSIPNPEAADSEPRHGREEKPNSSASPSTPSSGPRGSL